MPQRILPINISSDRAIIDGKEADNVREDAGIGVLAVGLEVPDDFRGRNSEQIG